MTGFRLKTVQAAVRGTAEVPGSKSETNRALVLSALAEAPSTVSGVLDSRDCALMMDALRGLGVTIDTPSAGTLRIQPPAGFRGVPDGIDCGLAGTVMRFAPPLAALADAPTRFFGDAQATKRPMLGLLDGLRQLGAKIDANSLPFTLSPGPFDDDAEVAVDSSASSQFISGMLMIGARLPSGLRLRHTGLSVPSRPHIAMTIDMLRARGVHVDEPDSSSWRIHPGPIRALDLRIEPDLTNAAAFLAAGAVTGGTVTVPGWPSSSLQPGAQFLNVAERMGCVIVQHDDEVTVTGPSRLQGVDVDLHGASELTPVVTALASVAEGKTRIRGVAHIRGHETDRLAALTAELEKLGVAVTEHHDGLEITGGLGFQGPVELTAHADHRMAHFAAMVALVRPETSIDDISCVSKTMPDFPQRWEQLVSL